MESSDSEWIVQAFGDGDSGWEVSLVRKDNEHGQQSYGWCDKDISDFRKCEKILVGNFSPGLCSGKMVPEAFDAAIELANKLLKERLS